MSYLIDTNILIYYFNDLIDDDNINSMFTNSFRISIITKIEFLGWKKFLSSLELYDQAREFISYATVFNLSEAIRRTNNSTQKTIQNYSRSHQD